MQIGVVAKKTGLSVDAIRFYERSALLPNAPRTAGGFRRYGESDLEALAFIRRAKALGFTLSEVRELLELRRRGLEQKILQIRQKLAGLQKLRRELNLALRACNRAGGKRSVRCPLLREPATRKLERAK